MEKPETKSEVVVITGASAGIGRATVRLFAREGANIGLIARGTDGLEGARAEVEMLGGKAIAISADVANADEVEAAAQQVEDTFGPIDIWINNAVTSILAPFDEITAEEFRRVTDVAYLGYVWGTMSALRRMKRRNRGTIVQIGSVQSKRSIPLQSANSGAKQAIDGFTETVRAELQFEKSDINLISVHVPATNTPQFDWAKSKLPHTPHPLPPIYQPEVIAKGIFWAAHSKRRELFIGISTAGVRELNRFIPGAADRLLGETAYQAQQTDLPPRPNRGYNLFEPVPGDHGSQGGFRLESLSKSRKLWLQTHRNTLGLGALGFAVGLWFSRKMKTKQPAKFDPRRADELMIQRQRSEWNPAA